MAPAYAVAHSNLANAWRIHGRCDEALDRCRHALTLAPPGPTSWNMLGVILQALGRSRKRVRRIERAIELDPAYAEAWNNLCNILQGQLRWTKP